MNKYIIKNYPNYISMRNTERRKNNLSMQLDTTRSDVSLFIFPDATKHKKDTQKPNIKNELRQTLENRIQIEEKSRSKFKKRQYNNNYYYDYNYNPFIDVRNQVKQFKVKLKNKHGSFVNLVNLLEQQRNKKTQNQKNFLKEMKNFQIMKQNYILRSNKLQQKSQVNIFNKKTTKKQLSPSSTKKNKSKSQLKTDLDLELEGLQIEQIAAFKERNFFMDQKINIFHIVRNQISQINSNDYLKKRKFSIDSIVEKKYLIKLPIFRDLSQMGRNCVTEKWKQSKNIVDYIFTEQETINIWHAQFADLLSVASNRISSDYLHQKLDDDPHLNHRYSDDNSSEEQGQVSVIYKKKQLNRRDNFSNINQEYEEVKDYLKSANLKAEEDNQRRMQQHSLQIMKEIKNQRDLTQLSINDDKVHLKLSDKTKQQIKKFIGFDKPEKTSDFSKLVSKRKSTVNKKSVIKLKALNNLLGQKNKLQQFKQKTSRSKSFKKMRRHSEI